MRDTRKWMSSVSAEADGSRAWIRLNMSWADSLQQDSCMAEKRASLLGKCLKSSASETAAASANSRVVVPSKPFSAKTWRTARMMAARRSSPLSLEVACLPISASPVTSECILTHKPGQERFRGKKLKVDDLHQSGARGTRSDVPSL